MKKLITVIAAVTALFISGLAMPVVVRAAAIDDIKASVGEADPGSPTVNTAYAAGVNILSTIIGFTAIVMLMFGGFRYITSAGDANKAASAKRTIMYALIGIVVVMLTQTILRFTIAKTLTL